MILWPNKLIEKFRQIREEMGLSDDYTIQSIRHTCHLAFEVGSFSYCGGSSVGHTDTDTIFRHYRKYVRGEDQALVDDLEENFRFVSRWGKGYCITLTRRREYDQRRI